MLHDSTKKVKIKTHGEHENKNKWIEWHETKSIRKRAMSSSDATVGVAYTVSQ